jgi:hypothetical protein
MIVTQYHKLFSSLRDSYWKFHDMVVDFRGQFNTSDENFTDDKNLRSLTENLHLHLYREEFYDKAVSLAERTIQHTEYGDPPRSLKKDGMISTSYNISKNSRVVSVIQMGYDDGRKILIQGDNISKEGIREEIRNTKILDRNSAGYYVIERKLVDDSAGGFLILNETIQVIVGNSGEIIKIKYHRDRYSDPKEPGSHGGIQVREEYLYERGQNVVDKRTFRLRKSAPRVSYNDDLEDFEDDRSAQPKSRVL